MSSQFEIIHKASLLWMRQPQERQEAQRAAHPQKIEILEDHCRRHKWLCEADESTATLTPPAATATQTVRYPRPLHRHQYGVEAPHAGVPDGVTSTDPPALRQGLADVMTGRLVCAPGGSKSRTVSVPTSSDAASRLGERLSHVVRQVVHEATLAYAYSEDIPRKVHELLDAEERGDGAMIGEISAAETERRLWRLRGLLRCRMTGSKRKREDGTSNSPANRMVGVMAKKPLDFTRIRRALGASASGAADRYPGFDVVVTNGVPLHRTHLIEGATAPGARAVSLSGSM